MSSVLRSVRKRKKGRTLGAVDVIDREGYAELEVDAKVELIRSLVPLGLLHIEELLDEEVTALAGERYARKDPSVGGRRHGSNPGTVGLAGQRVPIRVPRIRHVTAREIPRRSYEALHGDRAVNDLLLRRVLYGISCRNYAAAAEAIPGAIGLSGSTVSRAFIQASATKLRELQERDLSGEDVVALVLDGKTFAESTMVVALGITMTGDKRFLGFVETGTENEKVLTPFLRSLVERGLDVSQGLLVIVDGGKGLRAAVRQAFRHRALGSGRPGSLLTLAPHRSGRAGSAASGSSTDGFATRRRVPAGPGSQAMAPAIPKAYLASSAIRCRDVETGPNLGVLAVFPSTGAPCRCPLPSTGSRGLNSPASAVLCDTPTPRRPSPRASLPSPGGTIRAPAASLRRTPGAASTASGLVSRCPPPGNL